MHAEKYTRAATGHMLAHYERRRDENGIPVTLHRENVNDRRSYLNYNLAPSGAAQSRLKACLDRDDVKCLNRADVNVLADVVITAPKGLPEREHEKFFKAAYEMLSQRYGVKADGNYINIVSAWVHRDETSDHMHFAFVPLQKAKKFDKKQQKEISFFKVNAKQVINRKDLQTLHPDMSQYMQAVFGRDIGIENGATKGGNETVEQLKYKSKLEKDIEDLKTDFEERQSYQENTLEGLSMRIQSQKETLSEQNKEITARNAELAKIETSSELGRVLIERQQELEEAESDLKYIQSRSGYRACNEVIDKWKIDVPVYMSSQNNDKLNEGVFQTIVEFLKEIISSIKEVFSKLLGEDFEQKQQEIKTEIEQDFPTIDKTDDWGPDITEDW